MTAAAAAPFVVLFFSALHSDARGGENVVRAAVVHPLTKNTKNSQKRCDPASSPLSHNPPTPAKPTETCARALLVMAGESLCWGHTGTQLGPCLGWSVGFFLQNNRPLPQKEGAA